MQTKVIAAYQMPNRLQRMAQTSSTSRMVGSTLNSMKLSRNSMPLVPRSIARLMAPVRRSRWKRRLRPWRWRKVRTPAWRIARWATLAKTPSRSSPKVWASTLALA